MPPAAPMPRAAPRHLPRRALADRLELIVDWYLGMISPETQRLAYAYDPETDQLVSDGSPIRDIAAIWDMALVSRFLERAELHPVIERSLAHHAAHLQPHAHGVILDAGHLGEPSGIAHSAFLALAMLASGVPGYAGTATALIEAILIQQRADGSYAIFFGGEPDEGLELYPAEAMLAIMEAYAVTGDARYLASVERGFAFHRLHRAASTIAPDYLVFHANWQAQYGALLYQHAEDRDARGAVRDHVFALHDRIVQSGFYERVERDPDQQATVEVACALEGANDAFSIAVREQDARRMHLYERCVRRALRYLLRAQRMDHGTPRERGGFGHSLTSRTQRIDVTGHVSAGFIKSVRNRIGLELDLRHAVAT